MSGSGSSSSAAQQELLPLISCPICGKPLLTSIARKGQRPGSRYYKCVDYDDGICPFFEFQEKYARRVAQDPPAPMPQAVLPAVAAVAPAVAPVVLAATPAPPCVQQQPGAAGTMGAQKPAGLHGDISMGRSYQVMAAASLLMGCANLLITIFVLGVVLLMYLGPNTQ